MLGCSAGMLACLLLDKLGLCPKLRMFVVLCKPKYHGVAFAHTPVLVMPNVATHKLEWHGYSISQECQGSPSWRPFQRCVLHSRCNKMAHLIIILCTYSLSRLFFTYLPCKLSVSSLQYVLLVLNELTNDLAGWIKQWHTINSTSTFSIFPNKKLSQASTLKLK